MEVEEEEKKEEEQKEKKMMDEEESSLRSARRYDVSDISLFLPPRTTLQRIIE